MATVDVTLNAYALIAAIFRELTVDEALSLFGINESKCKKFSNTDVARMAELKKRGYTYDEIGSVFYVSGRTIQAKIKRYEQRNKE